MSVKYRLTCSKCDAPIERGGTTGYCKFHYREYQREYRERRMEEHSSGPPPGGYAISAPGRFWESD